MADLLILLRRRRNANRIPFYLKDNENPFEICTEIEFIKRFRLSKVAVLDLCAELRGMINHHHYGYSEEFQVLLLLKHMATGSFQFDTGDNKFLKMNQSMVSKIFNKMLDVLLQLRNQYLKFPITELMEIKVKFYQKYGFPNVVGAIDGTHIVMTKPHCDDFFVFMNRKSNFSINVQMVCDADMKITDVVARWPGSCHDSYIWRLSGIKHLLETSLPGNYLVGDSGYPLEECLMVPYLTPVGPHEEIFNEKLRKLRNIIERCFGVLKSRFRIVSNTGGHLKYKPETVCKIAMAAAILHNICMKYKVPLMEPLVLEGVEEDDVPQYQPRGTAIDIRNRLALAFQAQR